ALAFGCALVFAFALAFAFGTAFTLLLLPLVDGVAAFFLLFLASAGFFLDAALLFFGAAFLVAFALGFVLALAGAALVVATATPACCMLSLRVSRFLMASA